MRRSMGWRTRSLGSKAIASRFLRTSLKNWRRTVSSLLALPGEVSVTKLLLLWHELNVTGPGYRSDRVFNLKTMEPYSLQRLYDEYSVFSKHMVLYIPRTSDLKQIAKLVPAGGKATVMHYCMEGASKALCIFYGDFNVS